MACYCKGAFMVLLISLLLASLMIFIGGKWIREHSGICYLICIAISLCVIVGVWLQFAARLTGLASTLALVLTQGGFAGALFIYIMYASAVQPKARLKKAVIPIEDDNE